MSNLGSAGNLGDNLVEFVNLAPTSRGTFLTRLTGLTRFIYILYIQNIPSILSKKGNPYTIELISLLIKDYEL